MKLLLTGKNGQLGFELARALAPLGELVAVGRVDCDLSDAESLRRLVRAVAPTVIVNPAAYTAVDKAESEPELAHAVNAEAPRILGEEAVRLGAPVVHYSTDYVFDGAKAGAYVEGDATHPQGIYGGTKRDGEVALRASGARHLVLRTSWVVGAHGGNFAKTMLRLAAEQETLFVIADQWGAPTSAALLADLTAHLVRQLAARRRRGLSLRPVPRCSGRRDELVRLRPLRDRPGPCGRRSLKAGPGTVKAITTAEYPTPARRPANSRLDTHKLQTRTSASNCRTGSKGSPTSWTRF